MYSNQQTERHKLHHQLIDIENKPCSNPACQTPFYKREIHRIIPALGYVESNVIVRDFNCHHFKDHPNSKFRVGDRIILNGRTPQFIDLARHRPRTIINIKYDKQKKCNFYLVGSNCRGVNSGNGNPLEGYTDYWFRSYQMHYPRHYHYKRQYIRHNPMESTCDKQESLLKDKVNTTAPHETRILTTGFNQI